MSLEEAILKHAEAINNLATAIKTSNPLSGIQTQAGTAAPSSEQTQKRQARKQPDSSTTSQKPTAEATSTMQPASSSSGTDSTEPAAYRTGIKAAVTSLLTQAPKERPQIVAVLSGFNAPAVKDVKDGDLAACAQELRNLFGKLGLKDVPAELAAVVEA
jgi:hypothetical protein